LRKYKTAQQKNVADKFGRFINAKADRDGSPHPTAALAPSLISQEIGEGGWDIGAAKLQTHPFDESD
jgi:hypothetical protein